MSRFEVVADQIERLVSAAEKGANAVVDVGTEKYIQSGLTRVEPIEERKKPLATTLAVATLAGLTDYLKSDAGKTDLGEAHAVVHIVSPEHVRVFSALNGYQKQREFLIEAKYEMEPHRFKTKMLTEDFIVWLRSRFVESADRDETIKVIGNLRDGIVRTIQDDGFSQKVNVAVGVQRDGEARPKSIVQLQPFRTFPEVDQPTSPFIFRLYSGANEGDLPTASLAECDGGRWKIDAMKNIRTFLEEALPGWSVIG